MIALTLLVCWLIACVYVPFLLALTNTPPVEVRLVTNALVRQRASLIAASEPAIMTIRARPKDIERAVTEWRAARPVISAGDGTCWAYDEVA